MMVFLFATLFLLAVGGIILAYGTTARNKRRINLIPVSCPRCNTPLPRLRDPQSLRQAISGGWTCPVCGAGVDRRGEAVALNAPRTVVKSEDEMWRGLKKRIILMTPV